MEEDYLFLMEAKSNELIDAILTEDLERQFKIFRQYDSDGVKNNG